MQTLDQIVYQQADKKNPDVALQIDQLCIKNLQRKGVLPLDYKSSKYLLIASAGEKIIGFATLTDYGSERFELEFAVEPDLQRNGIATDLIEFAISFANKSGEANGLYANVLEGSLPQRILEEHGFSFERGPIGSPFGNSTYGLNFLYNKS